MMRNADLSYQEVLSCLEDAKQGLLSPYWQNYANVSLTPWEIWMALYLLTRKSLPSNCKVCLQLRHK